MTIRHHHARAFMWEVELFNCPVSRRLKMAEQALVIGAWLQYCALRTWLIPAGNVSPRAASFAHSGLRAIAVHQPADAGHGQRAATNSGDQCGLPPPSRFRNN